MIEVSPTKRAFVPADASLEVPPNIVEIACDRHARQSGEKPAIIVESPTGRETFSFARLKELSQRFANVMAGSGIRSGDRVAILLGQGPEFPIAMLGCWRIGAIAVPIAPVFSGGGLLHRLQHSAARAVVTDASNNESVATLRSELPDLSAIWCTEDESPQGTRPFWSDLEQASASFAEPPPGGDAPAYVMYTSGTTGKAKGALHSHAGFVATLAAGAFIHHDPQDGDVAWSPASWAWIAGFGGLLFYFLSTGRPVVAWNAPTPFDPEQVYDFLARNRIRNTLLTPTMLRMMRRVRAPKLSLRTMLCTGEAIDENIVAFCRDELGVMPCEAYGQTECAPITANNPALMPPRLGSLGRPIAGLTLAVLSPEGRVLGPNERGELAIRRDSPCVFQEYWCDPETTAAKFQGEWLMTGDEGWRDNEGFFWFVGRSDDVIKSSGYRIGPGEIESCLARHPAVELVAAFGLPDPERGSVVAAAIKLHSGIDASDALAAELLEFGRSRLERHEYPRKILFVDRMPLTGTGKVMRKDVRACFSSSVRREQAT